MRAIRRDLIMSALMGAVFVYALAGSGEWGYRSALFPQVIGVTGLICIAALLFVRLVLKRVPTEEDGAAKQVAETPASPDDRRAALRFFAWLVGVLGASVLIGQLAAMPIFVALFLKVESRLGWSASIIAGAVTWGFLYGIFEMMLQITWLDGTLWRWLGI